jgi:aminoglycoside phosphotransferase (APT) family kinase protein
MALSRRLGGDECFIRDVRRLRGGLHVATHLVILDVAGRDLSFVLRRYLPGEREAALCRREATGLSALEGSDLPVPRLLVSDPKGEFFGAPATAIGFLAGGLPERPQLGAWRQLGEFAARLHRCSIPAEMAVYRPSTPGAVEGPLGVLARDCWPRVLAEKNVFLHGDLCLGNALFLNDRLSGVVDWTRTIAGPPSFDLASLCVDAGLFGPAAAVTTVVRGYRSAGGPEVTGLEPCMALLTLRCRGRLRIWADALRAARMQVDPDAVIHRHRLLERELLERFARGRGWGHEREAV